MSTVDYTALGLEYIRKRYDVPAELGGMVRYSGGKTPVLGTITGTEGKYLLIRLDHSCESRPYHPTWRIDYAYEHNHDTGWTSNIRP